jgi:hypothetical protein
MDCNRLQMDRRLAKVNEGNNVPQHTDESLFVRQLGVSLA